MAQPVTTTTPQPAQSQSSLWQGEKPGFEDVWDTVNPMQHLPVVSGLYRAGSGDQIGNGPRLAGGALYGVLTGGPVLGLAGSAADVLVRESSGKDVGEHVASALMPQTVTRPVAPQPNWQVYGAPSVTARASGYQIYTGATQVDAALLQQGMTPNAAQAATPAAQQAAVYRYQSMAANAPVVR
ncbi:hypothetical protein MAIT1_03081 [Magnetofaba australis IT-1]|uniref:Uncharacterized protein n=1 Tax=Magnetofaba australis IT-1 TaxID=1434232 RepID=A0A1Y2K5K3_9PROT|nr:hypothetical protein MAIT1_03081 [Magnetofaba australis IT-1]